MPELNTENLGKKIKQGRASGNMEALIEAIVTCNCNRELTLLELQAAYPSASKRNTEQFLPHLNSTFKKYGINTCLRKAHFLAQVGAESGQLKYKAEILQSPSDEDRKYGGYKGRGLIQLTLEGNYRKYGDAIGKNLLGKNKYLLEDDDLATDSAGWFWVNGKGVNLNSLADKNDLIRITTHINGGLNGYDHRKALLLIAFKALLVFACDNTQKFENINEFIFESSEAYNHTRSALAWGAWHDMEPFPPFERITSKKNKTVRIGVKVGTSKDQNQAKIGYRRYIELEKTSPLPIKSTAYGLLPGEWKTVIEERLK